MFDLQNMLHKESVTAERQRKRERAGGERERENRESNSCLVAAEQVYMYIMSLRYHTLCAFSPNWGRGLLGCVAMRCAYND